MKNRAKLVLGLAFMLTGGAMVAAQEAAPAATPSASAVPEDQQPTDSQLTRLFEVMRVKQEVASVTKAMSQAMQQQMAQQMEEMQKDHPELANLTPERKEAAAKLMGKFMEQAVNLYSTDDMIADMKAIYKRHLTGSDVEEMITFYSSPSGQHMLDALPVIMQEFMPTAMQKMQEKMRPLMMEMAKQMAEITQTPGGAKPDQH